MHPPSTERGGEPWNQWDHANPRAGLGAHEVVGAVHLTRLEPPRDTEAAVGVSVLNIGQCFELPGESHRLGIEIDHLPGEPECLGRAQALDKCGHPAGRISSRRGHGKDLHGIVNTQRLPLGRPNTRTPRLTGAMGHPMPICKGVR